MRRILVGYISGASDWSFAPFISMNTKPSLIKKYGFRKAELNMRAEGIQNIPSGSELPSKDRASTLRRTFDLLPKMGFLEKLWWCLDVGFTTRTSLSGGSVCAAGCELTNKTENIKDVNEHKNTRGACYLLRGGWPEREA